MTSSAVTTRSSGLVLTDHTLTVPLDHSAPAGETIEIFAREVAAPDGLDRPYLVYLQGGPGFEAPRPTGQPMAPGWLPRALRDFRVLLLDQRGTGRSTPYGPPGADPEVDAERLVHYRADAIVADAELLREHLGVRRWSLLGQSFGGFCALHYLSAAPQSLREVLITGGLPPVGRPVDDVYAASFAATRRLNQRYHRQYPDDAQRLARLLDACDAETVRDPHGAPISRRLMRTIGHKLGMDGGAEEIHYLLEQDPSSLGFTHDLAAMLPFHARNPIYSVLHESSYCDGGETGWSSERVAPDDFRDPDSTLLTAEHIFPWHFTDTVALQPYREVAERLAAHTWPRLYDPQVLAAIDVPCAALVYSDDPYVLRQFAEETADALPSLRVWLTNQFLHNGLRTAGEDILDRLIGMARS
jgi:pimeloyl-ACP methyl ester carboxylesterase